MIDWKKEITVAQIVKQKVAEADVNHYWPYYPPEAGADENAIKDTERLLGFTLFPDHRAFLAHANGWKAFLQDFDVFGTSDLVGGFRCQRASELLTSLEDLKPLCGFDQNSLLPIAVSSGNIDLFAISKPNSHSPGVVLWFAGQLVEKFPSFSDWFLAMIDYNRQEFQRITGQAS